jgi:hypothetical protein
VDTPEVKHPERAEYRLPREAVGAYLGASPSKKSVVRLKAKVSDLLVPG